MPTVEELGQKVKARYPGQYDDLSDTDLGNKVKTKYPGAYDDFTSDTRSVSEKAKANLTSMESGPAKQQYEQAQASASQDIKNSLGRAAGETAAMLPFAAAAPFTAGASLPAGMAIMAGAGLASGAVREGTKAVIGSSEVPKGGDLALTLGIDTALGPISELGGRGLSVVTGKVLPSLLNRAAVKATAGKALVEQNYAAIRTALDESVGKVPVNIKNSVERAFAALDKLPEGKGALGEEFTGLTGKAAETAGNIKGGMIAERQAAKLGGKIAKASARQATLESPGISSGVQAAEEIKQTGRQILEDLVSKLEEAQGRISSQQPFDALIEMKGNIQQAAWDAAKLNTRERPIFRDLAENLDKTIKARLKGQPEAIALYERENAVGTALFQERAATEMATAYIKSLGRRVITGSTVGGAAGAYYGGSPQSAATGAALGVGATFAAPRLATVILRQAMAHPQAARQIQQGLEFLYQGKGWSARQAFERGMAMAGARETIKAAFKSGTEEPQPEQ